MHSSAALRSVGLEPEIPERQVVGPAAYEAKATPETHQSRKDWWETVFSVVQIEVSIHLSLGNEIRLILNPRESGVSASREPLPPPSSRRSRARLR